MNLKKHIREDYYNNNMQNYLECQNQNQHYNRNCYPNNQALIKFQIYSKSNLKRS